MPGRFHSTIKCKTPKIIHRRLWPGWYQPGQTEMIQGSDGATSYWMKLLILAWMISSSLAGPVGGTSGVMGSYRKTSDKTDFVDLNRRPYFCVQSQQPVRCCCSARWLSARAVRVQGGCSPSFLFLISPPLLWPSLALFVKSGGATSA